MAHVWKLSRVSNSQHACVSMSICLLVRALWEALLSPIRSKGSCVGINSYKFCLLFLFYLQSHKQMHELIFSGISSQCYALFDRKSYLKNKFENRFQKLKTGFRFSTENRISSFQLTSLMVMMLRDADIIIFKKRILR